MEPEKTGGPGKSTKLEESETLLAKQRRKRIEEFALKILRDVNDAGAKKIAKKKLTYFICSEELLQSW